MALAGNALSHAALQGVGTALAFHVHPVFGAVAILFFGALVIRAIEDRLRLARQTIVGVMFFLLLLRSSSRWSAQQLPSFFLTSLRAERSA